MRKKTAGGATNSIITDISNSGSNSNMPFDDQVNNTRYNTGYSLAGEYKNKVFPLLIFIFQNKWSYSH